MAKTIKFNLILDKQPVRTIDELRENFSIEDMLKYFKNGLLLRWLKVRGYEAEYKAVKDIDNSSTSKDIVISLIKIFGMIDVDMDNIEKEISILDYQEQEKELNKIYAKNAFAKKQVIEDYHAGYDKLILHMEENSDKLAILKADTIQMEREYSELFFLNHYDLYFQLLTSAPKAIFSMLTRDVFREYWIGENANEKIKTSIKDYLLGKKQTITEILGDDLKIVKRDTEAMWDPIEKATVKVMILSIDRRTFIKNAGNFSEKLGYEEVIKRLPRLKGLEYQSNSDAPELLYMEV